MSVANLRKWEKAVEDAKAEEAEAAKRRELKRTVREVLPKRLRVAAPTRPPGRRASGGFTHKEIKALKVQAEEFLSGEEGLRALEREVRKRAVTILLIDGILGTEPWRSKGLHAGIVTANARVRYLDNAIRILDDMRRGLGQDKTPERRLLEGVIEDAEIVK